MKNIITILFAMLSLYNFGQDNNKIKLEKIIYHTSSCFGNCPTYHLEILKNGTTKIYAEKVYEKGLPLVSSEDSTKSGYFKGKLSLKSITELVNVITDIGVENLKFDSSTCCDGSVKTIIIYYNGRRKYLKSMFPPENSERLIKYLNEICTENKLTKTNKKFKIEN